MALFDVFKKKKEKERFDRKRTEKDEKVISEKKEKEEKKDAKKEEKKASIKASISNSKILIGPHITEKSTFLNEKGAYVFKIKSKVNKIMIKQAIKEIYGVRPETINISHSPLKRRRVRGKEGIKKGFKKAVVYLKKGDKIEVA